MTDNPTLSSSPSHAPLTSQTSSPHQASIQRVADMFLIHIPRGICLYSASALTFLRSIEQLAEALHRNPRNTSGVLLLQIESCNDGEITWLKELESDVLFSTLVDRIDAFRWILSLIRNSPRPWVFMSASHCLGSTWDLALSCQRRYWFEPHALVGFPEIKSGSFPPGGVLESLSRRDPRTREKWHAKSVYSAQEAQTEGFIEFCSKASLWEKEALAVFRELLSSQPLIGVRQDLKKRRKRSAETESSFDLSTSIAQRSTALEQLETVWKTEHSLRQRYPHAWEYCWQLEKERSKIDDPLVFGRLVAHIAARHYLTQSFQAWLRTEVVASSDPCFLVRHRPAFRPEITIDLDHLAPPTEILLRFLKKGCALIFTASESKALSGSLNILYGRLERAIGAPIARKYWDTSVSWYLGDGEAVGNAVMVWTADDRFSLRQGPYEASFRRLEGNASTAIPGILEWEGAELPESLIRLLPLASDGALRVGIRPQGLPTSVFLRSAFLEEIIRISRHAEGELLGVTAALRTQGWRFAGDDDAWDRFLKTRYDQSSSSPPPLTEFFLPLTKDSWEIGAWKHAKSLAKKKAGDLASRRWNQTALSQHMAMFLGFITRALASKQPLLPLITADHLAYEALGFPQEYGTPVGYLHHRGLRRVAAYAKLHWPAFSR